MKNITFIRIFKTTQHITRHCYSLKATPTIHWQPVANLLKILFYKIQPAVLILPAMLTQSINVDIRVQTKVVTRYEKFLKIINWITQSEDFKAVKNEECVVLVMTTCRFLWKYYVVWTSGKDQSNRFLRNADVYETTSSFSHKSLPLY
jgi:hypothetical protein